MTIQTRRTLIAAVAIVAVMVSAGCSGTAKRHPPAPGFDAARQTATLVQQLASGRVSLLWTSRYPETDKHHRGRVGSVPRADTRSGGPAMLR
jgi:hypothetical protein